MDVVHSVDVEGIPQTTKHSLFEDIDYLTPHENRYISETYRRKIVEIVEYLLVDFL